MSRSSAVPFDIVFQICHDRLCSGSLALLIKLANAGFQLRICPTLVVFHCVTSHILWQNVYRESRRSGRGSTKSNNQLCHALPPEIRPRPSVNCNLEAPVFFPHRCFAPLPPSVSLPFLSTKRRGEMALVFWKSGPGSFPVSAALTTRPITETREHLLRPLSCVPNSSWIRCCLSSSAKCGWCTSFIRSKWLVFTFHIIPLSLREVCELPIKVFPLLAGERSLYQVQRSR